MGFTVLIAEDDKHTRTILEHIFTKDPTFKSMNIELLLASDGEQAFRFFKSHTPNLIISDLLMPKMDGFAFCRAVRETPKGKDLPLVITSAIYKETALLNKLRDELNVLFFPKPFQVREFTNEILQLINKPVIEEETKFTRNRITMSGPFKGSLEENSLPSIMLNIFRIEGTGVLTIERGKMRKEIFFQFGRPIGAESNVRHENLGNYLVNKKIINEHKQQQLLIEAKDKGISFLKALLDSNEFNDDEVLRYHSSLVKVRIVNSFRWHSGTFFFVPGDNFSDRIIKSVVEPVSLIFAGLKRISDVDQITTRLENHILSIIDFTTQGHSLLNEFTRIFGDTIISRIDSGKSTVGELLGKGIDPMLIYKHIYIMAETDMISFQDATEQNTSTEAYKFQVVEDHLDLDNIKKAAASSLEPEDEISIVANVPPPINMGDGGLILDIPIEVETDETEDLHKMVKEFYLDLHEKDYFQTLELTRDATNAEIKQAYNKIASTFSIQNFREIDLGPDHFKLEEINDYLNVAFKTLSDEKLKQEYIFKINSEKELGEVNLDAEVLIRQGQDLISSQKFQEAVDIIEKAIKLKPDIGDYHSFLALAQFKSGLSSDIYTKSLDLSMELAPDSISGNIVCGKIFSELENMKKAITCLEKALELQPENEEAFYLLEDIYKNKGDWGILERLHRKLLHLCGNRRPNRTIDLAKSLARLYEKEFKDLKKAQAAWEIVLSVRPHDNDAQEGIQRINSNLQSFAQNPAQAIEDIWFQISRTPQRVELYESGFNFSRNFNPDLAFLFSMALEALNSSTDASKEYYNRYSPPFLARAWRQIDGEVWPKIMDKNDTDSVGKIFEILALLIPESSIFETSYDCSKIINFENLPQEWQDVIEYITYEISVPLPEIILNEDISTLRLGVNKDHFSIFTPSMLLNVKDTRKLCAMLTPLASAYWAGRALPTYVSAEELLNLLKAILEFIAPKGTKNENILKLLPKLQVGGSELKEKLSNIFTKISSSKGNINVTQWARGVNRSSLNLSLILTQNLPIVLSFTSPEHHASIIQYCVSKDHLDVRKMLGISINV